MDYFLLKFLALVTTFYSLFPCSISASTKLGNDAFVAFVKGSQNFKQFCKENSLNEYTQFLALYYGTHFGILYDMKKNSLRDDFRQKKCEKYREYLDILYKYFLNICNGYDVESPIFVLREGNNDTPPREIELVKVVAYFANTETYKYFKYLDNTDNYTVVWRLDGNGNDVAALKIELQNEQDLTYYYNKNREEEPTAELETYETNMGRMLEKLKGMAKQKEEVSSSTLPSAAVDIYDIVSDLPSFNFDIKVKDDAFIHFLRNGMQQEANGTEIEIYEIHLVHLHLMKEKWKWENLVKKPNFCPTHNEASNKYEKNLRVLNILYEYLFQKRYGKAAAVKPIFEKRQKSEVEHYNHKPSIEQLTNVLKDLNSITKCYFGHCFCQENQEKNQEFEITVLNEQELNDAANSEKEILKMPFQDELQMNFPNDMQKILQASILKAFEKELKALRAKWIAKQTNEDKEDYHGFKGGLRVYPF